MVSRRGALSVLLVAFCLAVSGCQTSVVLAPASQPTAVPKSAEPRPTSRPASAGDPPLHVFTYTDSATGNSIRLQTMVVDRQGDAAQRPDPGMEYVILHAVVRSPDSVGAFSPNDVEITTEGDVEEQTYDIPARYHPFDVDDVPDIGKRTGDLGFEVPRSARRIKVMWNDDSNLRPPAVIAVYRLH